MAELITIGKVADRTGCNIETIRYYEKEGLLPEPPRSSGGHRLYSQHLVERLVFIRRARQLGFSMLEIKQLHAIVDGEVVSCERVKSIADEHLEEISLKIVDLTRMQTILRELSHQCSGEDVPECPIISALQGSGDQR